MSDALCGPSNPLQQFKQQTQFDRTLQQDRLASRQSPAQGFRSANPNAGLVDPEFEAFQAGVPPSELPNFQPFQQPPQSYGGPAAAPSWANDFQQMHISSPPPFQQQRMPQSGSGASNWAQGFREHIHQTTPRAQTSASSPQQFQQIARYGGMNGFQSSFAQANMAPTMQSKGKEPATERFDAAAFEAAFDQARDDMMGEVSQEGMPTEDIISANSNREKQDYAMQLMLLEQQNKKRLLEKREQERLQELQNEQAMDMESVAESTQQHPALQDYEMQLKLLDQQNAKRIIIAESTQQHPALQDYEMQLKLLDQQNAKRIIIAREDGQALQDAHQVRQDVVEEQAVDQERAQEDDDALAATAQELLEKVQHNQTDKFRNSQFLSLMRKLRDREVKVEGDKMVETNNATTASSAAAETQTQPLNSPSAVPRFDNSEQRPFPLQADRNVDIRPYDYGIPHEEQDHDYGRSINPQDGQDVVDMLNQPGPVTDDIGTSAFDSSPSGTPPPGPFYGDLRTRNDALSKMLYGEYGTVSQPALPPH